MKKITFFVLFTLAFLFLVGCTKEVSYTVTFNSALGSAVESQSVKENETAVKPADPTRDGYSFGGWTYNGVEYDFATPVTSDITLTAKWSQLLTVKFVDANGNVIKEEQVEPGKDATAPTENPTKDGFEFKGWKEDFTNVQEDLVVTPKFEEVEYTITFKIFGEVYSKSKLLFGELISAPLEKEINGYEFEGWDNESDEVTGDMVINAIYTPIEYSLEFYLGSNKFEKFTTTYNIEDGATLPTISGYGYEFEGWYDAEGNEVTTLVGKYSDIQLFAKISGDFEEVTVDPTQTALFGENVTVDGKTYTMGIGIAANIAQAAATPFTNSLTIYVPAGTYPEEVAITGDNVTIIGPNAEVDPTDPDATRNAEAVITGLVNVAAELDNIAFIGLKFEGDGQIVAERYEAGTSSDNPVNNHENFLFKNNIVNSGLNKEQGSGFIVMKEAANSYGKNLQIISNVFSYAVSETTMTAMIYTDNVEDVVITGNVFKDIPVVGIWFEDTSKGLSGLHNQINNNVFENIGKSALLIDWADPHINSTTSVYEVNGNTFTNVGTTNEDYAIKYGNMNFSSTVQSVSISYNVFNGGSNYISVSRCKTDSPVVLNGNTFLTNPSYELEGATVNGYLIRVINENFEGSANEKLVNATAAETTFAFEYEASQLLNVTLQ